jgi:hypothetical protein
VTDPRSRKPIPVELADVRALLFFCIGESFAWAWHFSGDVPVWVILMGHLVAATGLSTYAVGAFRRIACDALECASQVLRAYRKFHQELSSPHGRHPRHQ